MIAAESWADQRSLTIPQRQKRVLFLYADTGAGHYNVAMATCAALQAIVAGTDQAPCAATVDWQADWQADWRAELHDPIAASDRPFLRGIFSLYAPVTRYAPGLFTLVYRLANARLPWWFVRRLLAGLLRQHLVDSIQSVQPDLIVCVHSLLTYPLWQAMRRCECPASLFLVVTDLASIHRSWAVPDVDRCFVPTETARAELIALGMPAEKLVQSGLPVHPAYCAQPNDLSRAARRTALGLHPELFTVLLVGGGEGVGNLDEIARELAASDLPLQMVIVAGRNRALFRRLKASQAQLHVPHRIFGYVHNMPELMRAADVVVTKAGSVTIAEALACGAPIVLSSVIGGQESGNVDFIVDNDVGRVGRTSGEVAKAVASLFRLDEQEMMAMRARAHNLSDPAASFVVAEQIRAAVESESAIDNAQWMTRS